jgi:hypothetical protein
MNIKQFITDSAPKLWIYVVTVVPVTLITIYAAWFLGHAVPVVQALWSFRQYRFGKYMADVRFKREWLSKELRLVEDNTRVRKIERLRRTCVVRTSAWVRAWIPGPPIHLVELDSVMVYPWSTAEYPAAQGPTVEEAAAAEKTVEEEAAEGATAEDGAEAEAQEVKPAKQRRTWPRPPKIMISGPPKARKPQVYELDTHDPYHPPPSTAEESRETSHQLALLEALQKTSFAEEIQSWKTIPEDWWDLVPSADPDMLESRISESDLAQNMDL